MKTRGEELRQLVQDMLPHAHVFWGTPPYDFLDRRACNLIAVNKKNATKRGEMIFKDGIVGHSAEEHAEGFVVHLGPHVADSETES